MLRSILFFSMLCSTAACDGEGALPRDRRAKEGELTRTRVQELLTATGETFGDTLWLRMPASVLVYNQQQSEQVVLQIMESLAQNDVIQKGEVTEVPGDRFGTRGHTAHKFTLGSHPEAAFISGELALMMGRPAFVAVTGVTQEGTRATALYTWRHGETQTRGTLVDLLQGLTAEDIQRLPFRGHPNANIYWAQAVSNVGNIPPDTASAHFVKFDDGWRRVRQ
jgi:hypothetical protein